MPIPSQPTTNISLGPSLAPTNRSISNEFGEAQPSHALSQFYRGGSFVANHPINNGVPTSGSIAMSQFNGSSIVLRYTISANTQNFNLLTYASSPSRVGTTKSQGYQDDGKYTLGQPGYGIEVVINPGVVIGSATRTQNAFETGVDNPTTGWHPDVKIVLKNQGQIIGAGGNGGATDFINSPAGAGQAGGTAVFALRPITIQNAGTFAGGGGGGGGGGLGFNNQVFVGIAGGGGGGGAGSNTPPNTGGAGGVSGSGAPYSGQAGTFAVGGNGGPAVVAPSPAGAGGRGGTITPTAQPLTGQAGTNGTGPPPSLGGAGGAAGFYIRGNANVTWQATGTQTGQAQPS